MKLTKQELKEKLNASITDEDILLTLLEDIEDSMVEGSDEIVESEEIAQGEEEKEVIDRTEEVTRLEAELAEMKQRYKERFLMSASDEKVEDLNFEEVEEPKVENVIDVKEI